MLFFSARDLGLPTTGFGVNTDGRFKMLEISKHIISLYIIKTKHNMLLFKSYDMLYILIRGDNWLKRKTMVAQKKSKWQQQQKPKNQKKTQIILVIILKMDQ